MIVLDEYYYVNPLVITDYVIPTSNKKGCLCLASCTTGSENTNTIDNIVNAVTPTGAPESIVIRLSLQCDYCREKGNTGCPHNYSLLPHWLNPDTIHSSKLSYRDTPKKFYEEILCVEYNDEETSFPLRFVNMLKESTPVALPSVNDVSMLLTTCDPSAGGNSETAFVSILYYCGFITVHLLFPPFFSFSLSCFCFFCLYSPV